MRLRGLHYILLMVIGTLFVLAAEPLIRRVADSELIGEKQGRIVDTSGNGVPGVTVIGDWSISGSDATGSFGHCELQKVVTTAHDGGYVIPSVRSELEIKYSWWKRIVASLIRLEGPDIGYSWRIVPYGGMIRAGDRITSTSVTGASARPQFCDHWNAPPHHSTASGVIIDPIA